MLADYPEMVECDSAAPIRRTEFNIRDSSACIVMCADVPVSPGTDDGMVFFDDYGALFCYFNLDNASTSSGFDDEMEDVLRWLAKLDDDGDFVFGVGGPRASEYEGIYEMSYEMTMRVLEACQ